jgi:hypothetical protein
MIDDEYNQYHTINQPFHVAQKILYIFSWQSKSNRTKKPLYGKPIILHFAIQFNAVEQLNYPLFNTYLHANQWSTWPCKPGDKLRTPSFTIITKFYICAMF